MEPMVVTIQIPGLPSATPRSNPVHLQVKVRCPLQNRRTSSFLTRLTGVSPTHSVNEEIESSSSASSSRKQLCSSFAAYGGTDSRSELVEMPYAVPAPQKRDSNLLETLHNNPTRKLGEAPLWTSPPPALAKQPAAAPTPVQTKKRSWGFGKRNSQAAAVAVH